MQRSLSFVYFRHINIDYLLLTLYWLLLILPLPIYFKVVSIILILAAIDIEFVYLLVIIAGFFKISGPIAEINNIIDLTMLSSIILIYRIFLNIMKGVQKKLLISTYDKYLIMNITLFIIAMVISLFYTLDKTNGVNKVGLFSFVTIPILLTPVIKSFVNKDNHFITKFIIYLIAHGTIFSFISLITNSTIAFNVDYIGLGRLSGCVSLSLLIYVISLKNENKLLTIFYFTLIVLNTFALILTTGRGPIISFILTPILFIMSLKRKYYFSIKYLTLILAILILMLLTWRNSPIYLRFYYRIIQGLEEEDPFNRMNAVKISFIMFKERPFWGYGIGSYYSYVTGGITGINLYPHNIILEIMAELGIIGLVIFSLFFLFIVFKIKHLLSESSSPIIDIILSLLIYFFLNSLFAGDINSNKFLWCFIGLLFSYKKGDFKNG